MNREERLEELKALITEIEYLNNTMNSLVYWDKITNMPPKGLDYRAKVMAYLADEQYRKLSSDRFRSHVEFFASSDENDEVTDAMIGKIIRNSQYINKIPEDEYRKYTGLIAMSEGIWEKAKAEDSFELLMPNLKDIFDCFRRFAEYWGYENEPYDALIGYYEEGLTTKDIDKKVAKLKPFLIDTIKKIKDSKKYQGVKPLVFPKLDRNQQMQIWSQLLGGLGFDLEAGRVDIGEHPTILANSPGDVRIVNTYREDGFLSGLYNILHAGGKGIYHQSVDEGLMGTMLADVPSFAFEEGIGRLYENTIGRGRGFWDYFEERIAPGITGLKKYSAEDLYLNANIVRPNPIRVDADEVTYLLHIIIRYELERGLISGDFKIEDLPEMWNSKYEEYLGITPANLREGVLQDIHWAAGYVGYFPTYFISVLSEAQIAEAIESDCGSIDVLAGEGRFGVVKDWLSDKVFRHGAIYSSDKLIEKATGKALSSEPFIAYLRRKYSDVYN